MLSNATNIRGHINFTRTILELSAHLHYRQHARDSSGGRRILTRDFEPKVSHGMNGWQRIVYVPSEGYFYGIYNGKSEEDWDIPDIWSPAQLSDL